jgi:hypothetical protein
MECCLFVFQQQRGLPRSQQVGLAGNVPAACMNSSGLQKQAAACRNTIAMQDQVTACKPRCDSSGSSSSSSSSLSNRSGTSHQQQLHAAWHNGICAHQ